MKALHDINEKNCTGCRACEQICPKKCIEMKVNVNGFLVPKIKVDECINCGRCRNVCPNANFTSINKILEVYAMQAKDMDILKKSTSGGIFSILSKYVIEEKGGVVFGASYNEKLEVEHIAVSNMKDLDKIRGSKYVQSNTGNTYTLVKQLLNQNRIVLFSGTACQIQGLNLFLNKEYDNLLTAEVVCHGVPSPLLFKKYIEWLSNNYDDEILDYSFRTKEKRPRGEHYKAKVVFANKTKFKFAFRDPYYSSFLNSSTLRLCCYECKFKNYNRVSDFTIGDFWGIEKIVKDDSMVKDGTSLVIVSSNKGKKVLDKVLKNCNYIESSIADGRKYNPSLFKSSNKNNISTQYLEFMRSKNYNAIFEIALHHKFKSRNLLKNLIPYKLKFLIKKYFV